jgi:hypothetical protein
MCGGQRTREGGREVMCMGCRHVVGDKGKDIRGRQERKERLGVDWCPDKV